MARGGKIPMTVASSHKKTEHICSTTPPPIISSPRRTLLGRFSTPPNDGTLPSQQPQRRTSAKRRLRWGRKDLLLKSLRQRETCGKKLKKTITEVPRRLFVRDFFCNIDKTYVFSSPTHVTAPIALAFGDNNTLALADELGDIRFINSRLPSTDGVVSSWNCHNDAIFDLKWNNDKSALLSGSGDYSCRLTDAHTQELTGIFTGHRGSIKSLSFQWSNGNVFASGGRDGNAMIWDIRVPVPASYENQQTRRQQFGPVKSIRSIHAPKITSNISHRSSSLRVASDLQQSVTSVLFSKDDRMLITSGAVDGAIKLWDMRALNHTSNSSNNSKSSPEPVLELTAHAGASRGFSSMALDATGSKLLASSLDSRIYLFDYLWLDRCVPVEYNVPISSFYIKASFSPDSRYILSGSSDNNGFIWEAGVPRRPLCVLQGHAGEVSAVDWNPNDFCQLATCSDDTTVKIWDIKRKPAESLVEANDNSWFERDILTVEISLRPDDQDALHAQQHTHHQSTIKKYFNPVK